MKRPMPPKDIGVFTDWSMHSDMPMTSGPMKICKRLGLEYIH